MSGERSGELSGDSSTRLPALDPELSLPLPVASVRRLAVLRANGLGDYVTSEPALAALRSAYPDAEITLLGAGHMRPLVEGRPNACDRFVEVPRMPGVRAGSGPDASAAELTDWFQEQQAYGYDLAVQLHGGGRYSNPVVRRLGARVTAGAATPDAEPLDRELPYSTNQHEVLRWLEVARACGAAAVRIEPKVAVTSRDLEESYEALPDDDRPLLAVHPGATDARRRWPEARLAAVAAALPDARVVVLGSAADRDQRRAVLAALGRASAALDLGGRLSLGGLLGLLSRSTMFLGNDSGPRHLAGAVGTPTVAVFTNANLADVAPLSRVWHRIAVSWQSRCSVCGTPVQHACSHGATALDDVGVDEVHPLAQELWTQAIALRAEKSLPLDRSA